MNEGKKLTKANLVVAPRLLKLDLIHLTFFNCKIYFSLQGRETKTRATKKKYQKGKNDSDDEGEEEFVGGSSSASTELQFMSLDKISNVLRKQESLSDAPDEFVEDIAQRLYP